MRDPRLPASLAALFVVSAATAAPFQGTAVDADGRPLAGVVVRASALPADGTPVSTGESVVTGPDGRFSLEPSGAAGGGLYVGLGRLGYENLAGMLDGSQGYDIGELPLTPLPPIDNVEYTWIKPFHPKTDNTDFGCNFCHGKQYKDWRDSEMAKSAQNPRVLSLYRGTNLEGDAPAEPGWLTENPDEAGPCANCHAPAAAIDAPDATRLDQVEGTAAEGVFCDVCHKIRDVIPGAGPGVGGQLQLQRPSARSGIFAFGPFPDVGMPMTASYNPLIKESRLCAGCHEWTNDHGVPVMSTFSEWSEMSGADPDALQCADCHMKKKFGEDYRGEPPPEERDYLIDDEHEQGMHGVLRSKSEIYPHVFRNGKDFAPEAAAVELEAAQGEDGALEVTVSVENVNAGHALPTGMPFRHMILLVEAAADGEPLPLADGPVVPDYGGEGDGPEQLAGRPGKGYARVLGDGTGARNVMFWKATEVIEDTRIRAAETDTVTWRFTPPETGGEAEVSVRLVYRRAFQALKEAKGWDMEDMVIGEAAQALSLEAPPVPEPDAAPPVEPDAGAEVEADAAVEPEPGQPAAGDERSAGGGCGCRVPGDSSASAMWLLALLAVPALARRRRRG